MPLKLFASVVLFAGLLSSPFCLAAASEQPELDASHSSTWLRLYQYKKKSFGRFKSAITADRFFFSPQGRHDPYAELRAAIEAFENPSRHFGTQNAPAACVFPARRQALQKLLGRSFPNVACKDLDTWLERIGADSARLVFVGAYPGNPASLLGHTFIRFANSAREKAGREGADLLSYSIGFAAMSDPRDGRAIYMLKGLTGGYPGTYEIEPHYMKVGLYNNSESRDLWDIELNLTPDEVRFLQMHFWELTFNATLDYYFIDENCSYRLLTLLEAVRSDIDLTSDFGIVVLPGETMRRVIQAGFAAPTPKFRSSVKRRLEAKLQLLSETDRELFDRARASIETTREVKDATVLDALLDYWLYTNYRAHAALDAPSLAIMNATYQRASEVKAASNYRGVADRTPPFLGHRSHWLAGQAGSTRTGAFGSLTYRMGAHPLWSSDPGYEDITSIEYLGADIRFERDGVTRWNLLLAKAEAFEDIRGWERNPSWSFEAKANNDCLMCRTDIATVRVAGAFGASIRNKIMLFYLLADARVATWAQDGAQLLLAPGARTGIKLSQRSTTLLIESSWNLVRETSQFEIASTISYALDLDTSLLFEGRYQGLREVREISSLGFGLARFF